MKHSGVKPEWESLFAVVYNLSGEYKHGGGKGAVRERMGRKEGRPRE